MSVTATTARRTSKIRATPRRLGKHYYCRSLNSVSASLVPVWCQSMLQSFRPRPYLPTISSYVYCRSIAPTMLHLALEVLILSLKI